MGRFDWKPFKFSGDLLSRSPLNLNVDGKAGVIVDLAFAGEETHIRHPTRVFHFILERLLVVVDALFAGVDQFLIIFLTETLTPPGLFPTPVESQTDHPRHNSRSWP